MQTIWLDADRRVSYPGQELGEAAARGDRASYFARRDLVDVASLRGETGETLLMAAVVGGDEEIISDCMRAGIDLDAQDDGGDTALHHAAELRNLGAVNLLLSLGADARKTNAADYTPLSYAVGSVFSRRAAECDEGLAAVVRALVAAGSPAGGRSNSAGDTALTAACRKGLARTALTLLDAGADPRESDSRGVLPLELLQGPPRRGGAVGGELLAQLEARLGAAAAPAV